MPTTPRATRSRAATKKAPVSPQPVVEDAAPRAAVSRRRSAVKVAEVAQNALATSTSSSSSTTTPATAATALEPPPSPSLKAMVDADRPVRWYYDPADNVTVQNVTVDFMYTPHSMLALSTLIGALLAAFFYYDSGAGFANTARNVKYGLALAAGAFLLIGLLVFPAGPFTRPHPLFWRLVFGVSVLYELVLLVTLMMNRDEARFALSYLYPDLGVKPVERSYADACEFTWANIKPAMFDIFFLSHFLGWVCKSIMMRDLLFCWTLSIGWELIELAFVFMLPNFNECWWDQWILDVLLTNGLGIYVGHRIAQHLEVKQYKWSGLYTYDTLMGKASRFLLQFTPESWMKIQWESFSLIRQFLVYNVLMFSLHLVELNAFFLKHILWVPPENKLNLYRLVLWWLIGVVSLRQIYMYMNNPKILRLGSQAWMAMAIQLTELLICVKFGRNDTESFPNAMPDYVFYAWCAFGVVYVTFCVWVALRHDGRAC